MRLTKYEMLPLMSFKHDQIVKQVKFHLDVGDITARTKMATYARHLVMAIEHKHTKHSTREIAERFGQHASIVAHAEEVVEGKGGIPQVILDDLNDGILML